MNATTPTASPGIGDPAPATFARDDRRARLSGRLPRFLVLGAAVALVGCGGGAGGAGGVPEVPPTEARGRVALGALGGATVRMYRVGDYGMPLATTTTSTGATADEVGRFTFPLPGGPAEAMYLLVATGGMAHDANHDGVLDGPTPNFGTVHALASAVQLERTDVVLSAVTEVVYQRARYFLQALYDDAHVSRVCDSWASFVLRSDLAAGPEIGNVDALAFDPRFHRWATFRPYAPHFTGFVDAALAGQPLTEAAFALSREELHVEELPGVCGGIAVVGDVAFLCRGAAGLAIWSVLDPTAPTLLSTFDTPSFAMEVQVVGTLAYVADVAGGLRIVDVSDPTAPVAVGSVALSAPAVSVHVVGDRAYLCSDTGVPALHVVDVTDPALPTILSETPAADAASTVRVEGNHAYLVETHQVETFDVTDPLLPVSKGTFATPVHTHIDVAPGHLFLANDTRFETLSLAAPATPQSIASLNLPGSSSQGLRVRGTRAFLMRGQSGLALVDVADPAQPSFLGMVPTSGEPRDAGLDGGLCVLSDGRGGLCTVGAGTPAPSGVVASVPCANGVESVEVVGNRLYAATDGPSELVVFDTSNPLVPVKLGSVPLASFSGVDISVSGDTAFVGERTGLRAYDVSDPAAPAFLDGAATASQVWGLATGPGVVYAASEPGVGVYDVTTPSDIALLTSLPLTGGGERVAYDGATLAVAAGTQGMVTCNATTPTAPTFAGAVAASYAMDVVQHPPFAFLSLWSFDSAQRVLKVVDYSVLSAPASVHAVVLPGMADRLSRSGDLVYASAWVAGVNVVDVTQPQAAFHTATIPVPANIRDLDVEGSYVYVAADHPNGAVKVLRAAQVTVP